MLGVIDSVVLVFAIDQGYEGPTDSQTKRGQLCESSKGTVW